MSALETTCTTCATCYHSIEVASTGHCVFNGAFTGFPPVFLIAAQFLIVCFNAGLKTKPQPFLNYEQVTVRVLLKHLSRLLDNRCKLQLLWAEQLS